MPVTQELHESCEGFARWAVVRARYLGADLGDIQIIIAPGGSNMMLGHPLNPALYVKSDEKSIAVNGWADRLAEYAAEHPHEAVRTEVVNGKCLIVKESAVSAATGEGRMLITGILWHELGHGYNERVGRTNHEGNAYLFELDTIASALDVGYFTDRGVMAEHVAAYVDRRRPQYEAGFRESPPLEARLLELEAALATRVLPLPLM